MTARFTDKDKIDVSVIETSPLAFFSFSFSQSVVDAHGTDMEI